MRGWSPSLLAALVLLCVTAPAQAETAYLSGNGQSKTLHVDGDPGEVNQPQIWPVNDNGSLIYWVRDVTTHPSAGAGCSQYDIEIVACPQGPVIAFAASLGDQDDSFSTTQPLAIPMQLNGDDGNDSLSGGDGADTLDGGVGNDSVMGVSGADVLIGGAGADQTSLPATAAQSISLDNVANDGVSGQLANVHDDIETVIGGDGTDTITGSGASEHLVGGGGADTIHGGGGADTISGIYEFGGGDCAADHLFGDAGDDDITVSGSGSTADGGTDDDVLRLYNVCADVVVNGGDGTDVADFGYQGPGYVTLDDVANDGFGSPGSMNIHADVENLKGSAGADVLIGSSGPNTIDGGPGNDTLDGGGGADVLNGGDGLDAVDYSSRTLPLHVDLDGQAGDDGETGEGDTVGTDVEGIYGSTASDVLTGGPGDDLIDGGSGADQISGGAGEDVVDYSGRGAAVSADADGVIGDDGQSGEGDSIAADVEDLIGGDGNDTLTGNAVANVIWGGPGNDVIAGSDGDDGLVGEAGDDNLDGGGGTDEFFADEGDDTIAMRDDVAEAAACGDGIDTVTADTADITDPDCETVSRPLPPPKPPRTGPVRTSPTPVPKAPLPPPPPDLTAPKASLVPVNVRLRRAVTSGVTFRIACNENCSTAISFVLSVKQLKKLGFVHAKNAVVVARGSHPAADAKLYTVVVRFTAKMRKRLAKARSLRLEVRPVFGDLLNNKIRPRAAALKLTR